MSLCQSVGGRLRASGYHTTLVAISITYANDKNRSWDEVGFRHIGRQRKLKTATNSTTMIHKVAVELFHEVFDGSPVRKLRVRVSDLTDNRFTQLALFDTFDYEKHSKLDQAVDDIRRRFGSGAIKRASHLHSGIHHMAGGPGAEDYPVMSNLLY